MIDLISNAVGGRVLDFNDEFFAEAENLLKVEEPVWREGEYTDRGKWMDGWETRRRREAGHDWCVLALGIPGRVERVEVDTAFFTGNYPEQFSLEGCGVGVDERLLDAAWKELVPKSDLEGDSKASFEVSGSGRVTHLRLNIFPDGGVARLRVEGAPVPSMEEVCPDSLVDLASQVVGGEFIDASDFHYNPPSKMLRPTEASGMWDGWETKRRRGPGHDWASFRLGMAGEVVGVDADTTHFKGNAPGWVSVDVSDDGADWQNAVDRHEVDPDSVNHIAFPSPAHAAFVRLSIHPDGGMARFRVWGRPDLDAAGERRIEYLNSLDSQMAHWFFHAACDGEKWIKSMSERRPFGSFDGVLSAAEDAFDALEDDDWLQAFAAHARIGEPTGGMGAGEQAGAQEASDDVAEALARVNAEYEERFGFTYIVYATGKTAEEMLAIARVRLGNGRDEELKVASDEQRRITQTRLSRMLCQEVR